MNNFSNLKVEGVPILSFEIHFEQALPCAVLARL